MQIDLSSIGYAAGQLQLPVGSIQQIAKRLSIQPSHTINGVDHFTLDQLERIARYAGQQSRAAQRPEIDAHH